MTGRQSSENAIMVTRVASISVIGTTRMRAHWPMADRALSLVGVSSAAECSSISITHFPQFSAGWQGPDAGGGSRYSRDPPPHVHPEQPKPLIDRLELRPPSGCGRNHPG